MLKEFKEFALKSSVIDMAIGVVIGGAFGKIVSSLVNDIIMPLITLLTGKMDFSTLFFALDGNKYETLTKAKESGASVIAYGNFITATIDFLIIAICIFLVFKQSTKLGEKLVRKAKTGKFEEEKKIPKTKTCPYCFSEINSKATRCAHCTAELKTKSKK